MTEYIAKLRFWLRWDSMHIEAENDDEVVRIASDTARELMQLEQFQQKCEAVLRPELRKNKEIEHFRDSEKSGNA